VPLSTRAAKGLAVVVLLVCGGGAGCASYTQKALEVRGPLSQGKLQDARAFLEEEKPGGDGLPYLMELGLVLRYQGEYIRSNQVFDDAEILVDELYTKSISKEILSLATSDEMIPYDGEMWERVLINYYRALNYVDLGQFDEALVECRKVNHKLKVYVDSSDDPPTYRTDAFAQYMTAILYEASGELNDAWVSLRLADDGYDHYAESYGLGPPTSLAGDLLRLADYQGFRQELEELQEKYPDAEVISTSELLSKGEIVVFYEEGFIPAKIQQEITIPILKDEYDDNHAAFATTLHGRVYHDFTYKKSELEYLLRLAIPSYPPKTPMENPGYAIVSSGEVSSRTELVQDLNAIARQGLDDRMGSILLKTILRGLTKYALSRGVEDQDELLGKAVNFLTAALEKADTRSWITLPNSIQVARLVVEPGAHTVQVQCHGPGGNLRESASFEEVEVGAGEVRILSHRTF
jgi:hypothetical protein